MPLTRRHRPNGAGAVKYTFTGTVHSLVILSNKAIDAFPTLQPSAWVNHQAGSDAKVDWLDATNHQNTGVLARDSAFGFTGRAGTVALVSV
jgi:hypothetical protein